MPLQVQGAGGSTVEAGQFAAVPLHVVSKPSPALGHYSVWARSGAIAAGMATDGHVFHARWTDAAKLAVIYEIVVQEFDNTTAFTAGRFQFALSVMRSWTVDGSGGTALTLTGDNQQLRTTMATSVFGAIRIATTAALGAGTSTADAQPIGVVAGRVGAIASKHTIPQSNVVTTQEVAAGAGIPIFSRAPASEHPLVLAQNEGIAIRGTVPATGVWSISVSMKWAEVNAY